MERKCQGCWEAERNRFSCVLGSGMVNIQPKLDCSSSFLISFALPPSLLPSPPFFLSSSLTPPSPQRVQTITHLNCRNDGAENTPWVIFMCIFIYFFFPPAVSVSYLVGFFFFKPLWLQRFPAFCSHVFPPLSSFLTSASRCYWSPA